MLSIDEAIEDFKTMAKDARGEIIHGDNLEPQERYYNSQIELCAKEKEQLAEWLEELKAIKDGSIPIIHGKAELELHDKVIRNEAIDDAKSVILQTLDNEILVDTIHLRLEQLKERNNE